MIKDTRLRRMAARGDQAPVLSPLRYPGAKRWMLNYVRRAITVNDLEPALFVELFAGGASVAINLLRSGLVERIGLVDRDPLVASFWKVLFFDTEYLVGRIQRSRVDLETWRKVRASSPRTDRERAYKCIFLNRTNFSGILHHEAGPIGGMAQASAYKIDCRFNKESLIGRIREIAGMRDRVAFVWNDHWRASVARIARMQERGSLPADPFYYLDPPFYKKADKLYRHWFEHKDHVALRDFLLNFEDSWVLSYDNCEEIRDLYRHEQALTVNLLYTTSGKQKRDAGKEVIVSNLNSMVSEIAGRRRMSDLTPATQESRPDSQSDDIVYNGENARSRYAWR